MMREPLVLLPGMMCGPDLFAPQVKALVDVAQPWVGDITDQDTIDGLADAVLAEAPFERFALAGLSMGGIVALAMADRAPERITRLGLLDSNARAETPERQSLRGPQIEKVRRGRLREVLVNEIIPNYLGSAQAANRDLLALVLSMGLALGPEVFVRQSEALRSRRDRSHVLGRFSGPVLVLCGAEDRVCPPAIHQEMAAAAKRAEFLVVPGAGHLPTLEAPDAVSCALRVWLQATRD